MNSGIGFKNMKVFKDKFTFEFKDITLFTGVNNSGKSSAINALQLLQENISSANLNGLLKTEFKAKKNKHGSIKSFINNASNLENNYFNFYQIKDKIEYRYRIEISDGIEQFGKISHVSLFHTEKEIEIFNLALLTPYSENFMCELNINFQYFIDVHRQKCLNTKELIEEIPKFKKICEDLDAGKIHPDIGKKYAHELMKKFSVYIVIDKTISLSPPDFIEQEKWAYNITSERLFEGTELEFDEIFELGVLFEKNKDFFNQNFFNESIESFNQKYKDYLNLGVFDFNNIWEILPEEQSEFEKLLCEFYNSKLENAYSLFSDDIIKFLSIMKWTMQERYSEEPFRYPQNLILEFTNCFKSDFGLFPSLFEITKNNNPDVSFSAFKNDYVNANNIINSNDKRFNSLKQKGFMDFIEKVNPILLSYLKKGGGRNLLRDNPIERINDDIQNLIHNTFIKNNCTFVSSNRFTLNRTYSFEDRNDLTNQLKELEYSDKEVKNTSFEFINKWLKEFDIADELKLKSDEETGTFKIYLKQNKKNILLADYGLGTNQILPIIFSLSLHKYVYTNIVYEEQSIISKTVIIEEPESNLHPSMQSKIAEMFVEAIEKFNVKIIAETHSEYLIRKLQYLVAKKESKINSDNVVIYYFYKPTNELVKSKKVKQVEKIVIDKFGRLSKEFGGGFFDEADNTALDLFLLNQYNKN